MIIKCDYCGKEFNKRPSHIVKSKTNCCSRECANNIKGSKKIKCDYCGKEIRRGKKYLEKSSYHYCSKECQNRSKVTKTLVKCDGCGVYIYRVPHSIKNNITGLYFCNMKCKSRYYQRVNQVVCVICKKKFYKNSSEQKRSVNHCCSIECANINKDRRVKVNCQNCNKVLYRPPSVLKDRDNIFCSKDCHDKFQDHKIEIKCLKCGKKVSRSPSLVKQSRHHFCSGECFSKFSFKESFVETQLEKLVKELNIKYDRNNRSMLGKLELDFYFPDINFAVEVNGIAHYEPIYGDETLKRQKKRDIRKRKKCKELGILLRIVKPGNCKYKTFMPRYKRVIWEIKQRIKLIRD